MLQYMLTALISSLDLTATVLGMSNNRARIKSMHRFLIPRIQLGNSLIIFSCSIVLLSIIQMQIEYISINCFKQNFE